MDAKTDWAFRTSIVEAARCWLGTPFLHQASSRGHGADCLGLVRGVWRDVIGDEPQRLPNYGHDAVHLMQDRALFEALIQHFDRVETDFDAVGDVVAYRLTPTASAQHLGITVGSHNGFPKMVHSYSRHGVVETPIGKSWMRRCVGQFKFPRGSN